MRLRVLRCLSAPHSLFAWLPALWQLSPSWLLSCWPLATLILLAPLSLPALWQLYAEGVFIILITPSLPTVFLPACLRAGNSLPLPALWQLYAEGVFIILNMLLM